MVDFIIQIFVFFLVLLSYIFVLSTVLTAPFILLGFFLGVGSNLFHIEIKPKFLARFSLIEGITEVSFLVMFLIYLYVFNLYGSAWMKIWENPIILGIIIIFSSLKAASIKSYIPMLRLSASTLFIYIWPLFILLCLGVFAPNYIELTTFKVGFISSSIFLLISGIFGLFIIPHDIQKFKNLDKRHDYLGMSLQKLQHLANFLGDSEKWREIREVINNVDQCYSQALAELSRKKFKEADALIIQAEIEVKQLENTLNNRIILSLPDEMRAKLKQAESDIASLREDFQNAGLNADNLNQLLVAANVIMSKISNIEISKDDIINQFIPYEDFFREIVDTRTALRFYQNVSSSIDRLNYELQENHIILQTANNLRLNTTHAKTKEEEIILALNEFQSTPINTSRELVNLYQQVQIKLMEFRASIEFLKSVINRQWITKSYESNRLLIYIPKVLSTTKPARVLIIYRNTSEINVDITSSLLNNHENSVVLSPIDKQGFSIGLLSIVGKRGGNAILTLRFKDLLDINYPISFDIRVNPSIGKIAGNSLLFAVPISGLAVLSIWGIGIDLRDSATIGSAIGGVGGLVIFLARCLKYLSRN